MPRGTRQEQPTGVGTPAATPSTASYDGGSATPTAMATSTGAPPIESLVVTAYTIPTDYQEGDGTLAWSSTTLVLVRLRAGDHHGIGYTYASTATALLIEEHLRDLIVGHDPTAIPAAWLAMTRKVRNLGQTGISAMAISAIDIALWDLKARILGLPLAKLLGLARDSVPIYGSGGFTSYPVRRLQEQLAGWAELGIHAVKMKVGADPEADPARVRAAREAIGPHTELFVDANGAYTRKQALAFTERFHAEAGVSWFEEPVASDDLAGLRLLRDRAPAGMDIAAGEYGYTTSYFREMLGAGAIDVLQADATRCGGITGFLHAATLAQSYSLQISAHTAPAIHLHPCTAVQELRNLEYFHDHIRIERMIFDGAPEPSNGTLRPDLTRPGLGLELRRGEAERYRVYGDG